MEKAEFRVIWKRSGLETKRKRYASRRAAERMLGLLTNPEPWRLLEEFKGREGDERYCCSGYQCGCEGETIREMFTQKYDGQPALEWARIESRPVGDWTTTDETPHADQ